MKFGKLRRLCNARRYDLTVYSDDATVKRSCLDIELEKHKDQLMKYDSASIERINPIWERDCEGNIRPVLEVELHV